MNELHSEELTGQSRTAAWNIAFAARIDRLTFACSRTEPFVGSLCDSDLGPLRIGRLRMTSTAAERQPPSPALRSAPAFLILIQLSGASEIGHHGHSETLREGDMILCDASSPLRLAVDAAAEMLLLRIPAATLKTHLPSPECFCGRALRSTEGVTSTATKMAVSLFEHLEAGLSLHYRERVAQHLLDVIATAYALAFHTPESQSSIVSGRCALVKLFIEQHLRDPDLTACMIASRLKLSPRYLRMIFAGEGETVSGYILRRRLEQCARQIGDPAWRGHSMTEIAFGWGFNSAPHFTRTFRDRFDMPPREYRRLKLEDASQFRRPVIVGRDTRLDAQAA